MSDYHPQTSPRTDAGKTRSSQNATTHGATSQQLILPGESQQDFDNLLANLTQEFQPSTDQGHGCVYDAARARWDLWRKQRIPPRRRAPTAAPRSLRSSPASTIRSSHAPTTTAP